MINTKLKNLIICAHYDDEVIGCSSILKEETMVLFVCGKDPSKLPQETEYKTDSFPYDYFTLKDVKFNELEGRIRAAIRHYRPEFIYTHAKDFHYDHQVINDAVLISTRKSRNSSLKGVFEFEVDNFSFNLNEGCMFKEAPSKRRYLDRYKNIINEEHYYYILDYNKYLSTCCNSASIHSEVFKVRYLRDF